MLQPWLNPDQEALRLEVQRLVDKCSGNLHGEKILIRNIDTTRWSASHPYNMIDVHFRVEDNDVYWDEYMPSDEYRYWKEHCYNFKIELFHKQITNPIYLGGE